MNTLSITNIAQKEGSLGYTKFNYPAGEMQVRLTEKELPLVEKADVVFIHSSIRSAEGVVELALLVDAVRGVAKEDAMVNILLPYLPFSRADRRFVQGDCLGLKVFGQLIGTFGYNNLVTLDVHSDKAFPLVKRLLNVEPTEFIERAVGKVAAKYKTDTVTVLLPDAGAAGRYRFIPDVLESNVGRIYIQKLACHKKRDPLTGALSGFTVPKRSAFKSQAVLMVDDICDGGGTFVGIAEALSKHNLNLSLYVSHGIFSQGVERLQNHFEHIYTTDSMWTVNPFTEGVTMFQCASKLIKAWQATRIEVKVTCPKCKATVPDWDITEQKICTDCRDQQWEDACMAVSNPDRARNEDDD